ncbi:MAG TPA: tetratricopeptide repeat protein [Caulobacteraceae bacterium]
MLVSIALAVHVVRTGRNMYWLWIIIVFQPVGGIVYFLAIVLPELLGGPTARKLGEGARAALDPEREYREARARVDDSPTVANQNRLANAAMALGRYAEAEGLYREAAHGIHSEDPALLMGRARALLELNRPAEALELLTVLGDQGEEGRTPQAALLLGRAYHALGRLKEADTAYQWAAGRLPGLEGLARYAVFLAETGRRDEAEEAFTEIEKRADKTRAHFRKEARVWRDLAAQALQRA